MSIVKVTGVFLFIILCNLNFLQAQQMKMSFDEMWAVAIEQNIQIKNAELLVEKSGAMENTAWDFGSFEFDFTRGQQNTELIDNMYTIRQGLGAPFTISATKKYYKSEQNLFRQNVIKTSREVKKELRSYYYSWLFERDIIEILDSSIVNYQRSADFAGLQYETGETNLLSKMMLSSEAQRLILSKELHLVNLKTLQNQIQTLLNTDSTYLPKDKQLTKLMVILPGDSTEYPLDSVPDVMTQRSQIEVMNRHYRLMKSQISPSLSAGYYTQEIDNVPGYQGWRVGLNFPLLFMPQKARSQAASIELSRAENQYVFEKLKASQEISSLLNKYNQLRESLTFYESERLENADLIDKNARSLYESGSIGYIEFVQNLTTARQIREDYVRLVNEYNHYVIDLYYYLDF